MSQIDDLPPLREVIAEHGLRAKKELGQNFLLDLNLTARIARVAGTLEGVRVIEVGPGPGGLTRALLAEGAREVVAIERDARALPALAWAPPLVQARGLLDGGCGGLAGGLVRVVGEGGVDAWARLVGWRCCCLLLGLH